jgi:hypothetical protein
MKKFRREAMGLELRSCNDHLTTCGVHTTAEIVKWYSSTTCFTLGAFEKSEEGYDFKFVGDRPFEEGINQLVFMDLIRIGYVALENCSG